MDIRLVDPGRQVPYYTRHLAASLAAAGDCVSLDTAPDIHYRPGQAPRVVERIRFGRPLASAPGRALGARNPGGRRLVRALAYPWELGGLLRCLVRHPPDVVHWQWSLAPAVDAAAFRYLGRRGIPVVLTVHNVLPHRRRGWHGPTFRRLYKSAGALVVHSGSTESRLRRMTGPLQGTVARIAMPVAVSPVPAAGPARAELDLPAGAPVALFFGHVRPYKGLDVLLAAWPLVRARVPAAHLVVAGPGAKDRPGARAEGIVVRPGYVPHGAVAALFGAADLVVLPYRDTYDSAVVATAFGYGRPVVATDVGGLGEALAPGGGRLVPPADTGALAEAVAGLLGDPGALARLRAQAAAVAKERSWAEAAREYRAVYSAVQTRVATNGAPIASRREAAPGASDPEAPMVSVIMAVRNEARTLPQALGALWSSTYPPDRLEVVVADGRSTDGTRGWLAESATTEPRLRVIDNPAATTPAGLNAALAVARGEVIVRLDGHTIAAPDYVSACLRALDESGADAVGGCLVPRGTTPFGVAVAEAMASAFGGGPAAFRQGGEGPTDTVYLGAWRRSSLQKLRGFDVDMARNQDYELCLRIRQAGGTVWLAPEIRSTTVVRDSPTALARQYFGYGAGRAATWARHPRSLKARQLLPATFAAALGAGVVAAPFSAAGRVAVAALVVVYAAAVLGAAVVRVGIGQGGMAARVAGAMVTMHLAWGAGFWSGLAARAARMMGGAWRPGGRA